MNASQSNQASPSTENDKTLNCLACSKSLPSFALSSGTVYCSRNCTPCKLRNCPTCAYLAGLREPLMSIHEKTIDLACGKQFTVYYDRSFFGEESEEHFAARTVLVTDALSGLSKEDGLLLLENERNAAALPERLLSLYYLLWNLEPKNLTCFVCSTTIDLKSDPLLYKCGRGEHLAHSQCLTLKRFNARKIDPMALYDCPVCHAPDPVCKIEGCAACKALRQFTASDLVLFQHFLEIVVSPHHMYHSCTDQVKVGLTITVYGGETVEHMLARAIMVHSLTTNISDFDRKRLGSIEDGGLEYKPLPDRFREIWYLIANSREEPSYVDYAHRWNGPIKRDTHAFCD